MKSSKIFNEVILHESVQSWYENPEGPGPRIDGLSETELTEATQTMKLPLPDIIIRQWDTHIGFTLISESTNPDIWFVNWEVGEPHGSLNSFKVHIVLESMFLCIYINAFWVWILWLGYVIFKSLFLIQWVEKKNKISLFIALKLENIFSGKRFKNTLMVFEGYPS